MKDNFISKLMDNNLITAFTYNPEESSL